MSRSVSWCAGVSQCVSWCAGVSQCKLVCCVWLRNRDQHDHDVTWLRRTLLSLIYLLTLPPSFFKTRSFRELSTICEPCRNISFYFNATTERDCSASVILPHFNHLGPQTTNKLMTMTCVFFFSYAFHEPYLVSHETASSSAECSRDKLPFSFVRGQDSTMWDMVMVSAQGHRSVSVSRHFLLQAPQCPCSVRKRWHVWLSLTPLPESR